MTTNSSHPTINGNGDSSHERHADTTKAQTDAEDTTNEPIKDAGALDNNNMEETEKLAVNKTGDEEHDENNKIDIDEEAKDLESDATPVDDKEGLPIDRGWAWVIVGACVYHVVIYVGVLKSFGVLFIQFQKRFNASAGETAVMSLIQNIVISITALLVMTIGLQKFSCRTSVVIGGICIVSSYLITAFATDLGVFYFGQGVLGGIGMAMTQPPMLAIIGMYFNKHRGLANSLFASGNSVGGLIFAPIVVKLFEEYGYTGTLLIMSGMFMNVFVTASLLRPISFFSRKKKKGKDVEKGTGSESKALLEADKDEDVKKHRGGSEDGLKNGNGKELATVTGHSHNDKEHLDSKVEYNNRVNLRKQLHVQRMTSNDPRVAIGGPHPRLRIRTRSEGHEVPKDHTGSTYSISSVSRLRLHNVIDALDASKSALYASGEEAIYGSLAALNCPSLVDQTKVETPLAHETNDGKGDISEQGNIKKSNTCYNAMVKYTSEVLGTIFDLKLLKNITFITFLVLAFCLLSGTAIVIVFVPPHAFDVGVSNTQLGMLISIQACIDLVAKIGLGFIADRNWMKRTTILAIVSFLIGTANHFIRWANSFQSILIYTVVSGLCGGQYISMYAVVLMEIIGPERFKKSLGFGTLIHGISVAVFFPIGGLLKDYTGTYVATFHMCGVLAYIGGFLVLLLPVVNKWTERKAKAATCDNNGTNAKKDNSEIRV